VAGEVCRFGVLGPLVVTRADGVVAVPSGRQRSLLALLLQEGGPAVSRDRLIDELWGETPPASAVSALHVHLSKLRGLLGGLLTLTPAGYTLTPGAFELDEWHFDALVQRARAEPESAIALLNQALALFRGEPLCDVASEGSIARWRRALEEKRLQALVLRIDAELDAGGGGELVAELELLRGQHPYEERVLGQLMLALYRAGRQADALDAYQRARQQFAVELGLEPGESLALLQQQILDRAPALLTAARRSPAPAAVHSDLPRGVTRLIGRERAMTALAGLMADPDVRMITLTGPGGVGKTRLLMELAHRHEQEYADGAVFVRLERLTDPGLVSAEIAGALARRDGTELPSADGLVGHLRERELLLGIDNFEHLLPAAVTIAELMTSAPRVRVLVSSRAKLRIRGEQVFEVEPLKLVGDDAEESSQSPAVQLFLQCALAANRGLEIDAEMVRTAAAICQALDGLPLAIELAAARSHSVTPAQIAAALAQPLLIGQHALRDLPDRQQTLQATMRWSYDLLSPAAQEVLRFAGVFLGGFAPEALAAVGRSDVQSALDELSEASLVRFQGDHGRYELLELVRAFALDELQGCGQAAEVRGRHRRYFAALVDGPDPFRGGGLPTELAAPLLADHANLRAALLDAIDADDRDSALSLALGLRPVWLAGMLRQESQELIEAMLTRLKVPAEQEVALLRVTSFLDYGPTGRTWGRRLADRAAAIGDIETVASAVCNLFGNALNARDRDEMSRLRPELLTLLTQTKAPRALGWAHYSLALDAYVGSQFGAACDYATLCMGNADELEHDYMRAIAIATRLLAQSARDASIRQPDLARALQVMRPPGHPPLAVFGLWLTARYAAGVEPAAAGRWLTYAERILAALDSELWPESVLRDETLAALGSPDLESLSRACAPLDHASALAEAAAWVGERDPGESAPRDAAGTFTFAVG
jgi:predicted ATPase/DNA-binding SARP family transcriptional activator